jgi:steroid 5-alpha reductase family enzyme
LPAWRWLFTAGYLVWVAGFLIEYNADKQLAVFLTQQKNKNNGKAKGNKRGLLDTGLWRYSRHPNYFGELVQWWGIGLISLQTSYGWVGLFGPLLLTILIRFVSGVPPIEKRRADDPDYQAYQRRTNALVPWFPARNK